MALVMVVSVVAVAAVLGYALLATTQLQAQAGGNVVRGASAEYLAESGVQLAMWHLQQSGGAWAGQSGISLGSSVPGTIDVACSSLGNHEYQITSTATLNGAQRISQANVALSYPLAITSDTDSDLLSGLLNFIGGTIDALLGRQSITLTNSQLLSPTWLSTHATALPTNLKDKMYGPADSSTGMFWTNGTTTLDNTVIRGMLVVCGDLKITGTGTRITGTSDQSVTGGHPAAVVVGGKLLPDTYSQATIEGGMWVGDQIGKALSGVGLLFGKLLGGDGGGGGTGSQLNVVGPLMFGSGGITSDGEIVFRPLLKVLSWNPASSLK